MCSRKQGTFLLEIPSLATFKMISNRSFAPGILTAHGGSTATAVFGNQASHVCSVWFVHCIEITNWLVFLKFKDSGLLLLLLLHHTVVGRFGVWLYHHLEAY
jgi:hypothetical protein